MSSSDTTRSYIQRFLHGGLWTVAGTGVSRILNFVLMAVLARMLGADYFGQVSILQSTLATIGTFAGLGLSNTSLRYIALYKAEDPVRAGRILGLLFYIAIGAGTIVCIFNFILSPWLATSVLAAPTLTTPLLLGSPIFLFALLGGVQSGAIIGFQNFRALSFLNLLDGLLSIALTLVLVRAFGLDGFAGALVLKTLGVWVVGRWLLGKSLSQHGIKLQLGHVWRERGVLFQFSFPAFLSSLSYAPIMWVGHTLLARNSGYSELGLFTAAIQINLLVTAFMTVFSQVSTSLLSESYGVSKEGDRFKQRFNMTLRFNLSIATAVGFLICIWPDDIAAIFGKNFTQGASIIPLTAAFAAVNVGCATCGQYFSSSGRMWSGLSMTLLWGLSFLTILSFVFPASGAKGMSISLLSAYHIAFFMQITLIALQEGKAVLSGLISQVGFLFILTTIALLLSYGRMYEVPKTLAVISFFSFVIKFIVVDAQPFLKAKTIRKFT